MVERSLPIVAVLHEAVEDLRRYAAEVPLDRLGRDRDAWRMVRQALQEAIQASIDIAQLLLADAGGSVPETYRELFPALAERCGLDLEVAGHMANAAAMRNVLVHVYTILDLERVHAAYNVDRVWLERYLAWVAARVGARG